MEEWVTRYYTILRDGITNLDEIVRSVLNPTDLVSSVVGSSIALSEAKSPVSDGTTNTVIHELQVLIPIDGLHPSRLDSLLLLA